MGGERRARIEEYGGLDRLNLHIVVLFCFVFVFLRVGRGRPAGSQPRRLFTVSFTFLVLLRSRTMTEVLTCGRMLCTIWVQPSSSSRAPADPAFPLPPAEAAPSASCLENAREKNPPGSEGGASIGAWGQENPAPKTQGE